MGADGAQQRIRPGVSAGWIVIVASVVDMVLGALGFWLAGPNAERIESLRRNPVLGNGVREAARKVLFVGGVGALVAAVTVLTGSPS